MQNIAYYAGYINPITGYKKIVKEIPSVINSIGLTSKPVKIVYYNFNCYSVKLAAFSGVVAILIDAYYNKYYNALKYKKRMSMFNVALQYHFLNALIMIGLPMCRLHLMAGTCIVSGKFCYCGAYYYYAFTGNKLNNVLPFIGKTLFIFICFILYAYKL